jgi:hypothetical protein
MLSVCLGILQNKFGQLAESSDCAPMAMCDDCFEGCRCHTRLPHQLTHGTVPHGQSALAHLAALNACFGEHAGYTRVQHTHCNTTAFASANGEWGVEVEEQ